MLEETVLGGTGTGWLVALLLYEQSMARHTWRPKKLCVVRDNLAQALGVLKSSSWGKGGGRSLYKSHGSQG